MNRSSVVSSMVDFLHVSTIELADWLNPKLENISANWWQECVIDKLSDLQRENADEKNASKLSELDLAALLRVAEKNWFSIKELNYLSESQKYAQRRHVKAMVDVRNNWAHIPGELPTKQEIIKDAETIKSFLKQLSSDESNIKAVIQFIDKLKKAGEISNDTVAETNDRFEKSKNPPHKAVCSINDQRWFLPKGQFIFDLADESTGKKCKVIKTRVVGKGGSCLVYSGTLTTTHLNETTISHNVIIKEFYPISLAEKGVKRKDGINLEIPPVLSADFDNALNAFLDGQRKHVLFANENMDKSLSPVFFSGEANNTYYVISELNRGSVLTDAVRKNYSIIEALELTKSICKDIYLVHRGHNGIPQLYLDIKPSNIFVDGTRAFLFDFNSLQNYKSFRFCSRSEGWSAPEQEFNKERTGYKDYRKIGFHTDVFSIAAVLFWLLTGTKLNKDMLSAVQKNYDWQKHITLKDTTDALQDDDFIYELDEVMKDMLCCDADERSKIFGTVNAAKDAERYVNYILKAANSVTDKKRHEETQKNIRKAAKAVEKRVSNAKSEIIEQTANISEAVQDVSGRVDEAIQLIKGISIKDTTPKVSIPSSSSQVNYVNSSTLSMHTGEVKAVYNDGSTYVGEWKYGNRQGYGRYTSSDKKKIYIGFWNCDLRCGQGRLIDEYEGEYNGNWEKDKMNGQGVYKYKDGRFYKGEWKDGVRSGEGYFIKPGEKTYTGQWENDKPSGEGVLIHLKDGSEYKGEFKNGVPNGEGVLLFSSGNKYNGQWKNGIQHGHGVLTYSENDPKKRDYYDGEWKEGIRKGYGTLVWKSGDKYVGECDDARNGHGKHYYINGDIYDGEWRNDKRHGRGKILYGDNEYGTESYDGEWENDQRKGHGILFWKDGMKYDGEWDGVRNGHGKNYYVNGDIYDGEWKDDKKHGHGIDYYANDDIYDGDWKDGKKHGHGVYIWKDGMKYDGDWKNGKRHGHGVLTYAEDDPNKRGYYDGEWENGIRKGHGVLSWKSGEKYDGEWDDLRNGHGIGYNANGDVYNGDWKGDKQHGHGILTYAKDDSYKRDYYDGEWIDGVREGKGTLVYSDGTKYEGKYIKDGLSGQVKVTNSDGSIEHQFFINGKKATKELLDSNDIDDPLFRLLKIEADLDSIKRANYAFTTKKRMYGVLRDLKRLLEEGEGWIFIREREQQIINDLSLCKKNYSIEAARSGDISLHSIGDRIDEINKCIVQAHENSLNEGLNNESFSLFGPQREVFFGNKRPNYAAFNSVIDNPNWGDERCFVKIREFVEGKDTPLSSRMKLEKGKQYEVVIYYHNNSDPATVGKKAIGISDGTAIRSSFPLSVKAENGQFVSATIFASDTNPASVWARAYVYSDETYLLHYVPDTAIIHNSGRLNQTGIGPHYLFGDGALIGVNKISGLLPGGEEYAGYVSYRFSVDCPGENDALYDGDIKKPVFNSVVDHPQFGNEKEFVHIRRYGNKQWLRRITLQEGEQYEVKVFFRNDALSEYNNSTYEHRGVAVKTTMSVDLPSELSKSGKINACITAENTPKDAIDGVTIFASNEDVLKLRYIAGSAKMHNQWKANEWIMPSNLFLYQTGTLIGLNAMNGVIPGGDDYAGYIIFVFEVT